MVKYTHNDAYSEGWNDAMKEINDMIAIKLKNYESPNERSLKAYVNVYREENKAYEGQYFDDQKEIALLKEEIAECNIQVQIGNEGEALIDKMMEEVFGCDNWNGEKLDESVRGLNEDKKKLKEENKKLDKSGLNEEVGHLRDYFVKLTAEVEQVKSELKEYEDLYEDEDWQYQVEQCGLKGESMFGGECSFDMIDGASGVRDFIEKANSKIEDLNETIEKDQEFKNDLEQMLTKAGYDSNKQIDTNVEKVIVEASKGKALEEFICNGQGWGDFVEGITDEDKQDLIDAGHDKDDFRQLHSDDEEE